MKLSDWMAESIDRNACIEKALTEKYHVISTCPSCEHYEKWEPIDMCNSPHNQDFGCVYWSEKK